MGQRRWSRMTLADTRKPFPTLRDTPGATDGRGDRAQ